MERGRSDSYKNMTGETTSHGHVSGKLEKSLKIPKGNKKT
jgi:hypothetical protein